jgi:hypothetical protein
MLLVTLVTGETRVSGMTWLCLVRLLMLLVLRMLLMALMLLMWLMSLVTLMALVDWMRLLVRRMSGMRLMLRVLLMRLMARMRLVRGVLLMLRMREYRIMLNRLAHRTGEHHWRRILLWLHLLPRRRAALALLLLLLLLMLLLLLLLMLLLDAKRIGDVWIRRTRRAIGNISVYRVRRRKEMLRIGTLGLLRRIGLGLIRRRGVRSGRLLVLLVWVTARLEAVVSTQTSLRKIQGSVRVGARRPQSRHDGALYMSGNILSVLI